MKNIKIKKQFFSFFLGVLLFVASSCSSITNNTSMKKSSKLLLTSFLILNNNFIEVGSDELINENDIEDQYNEGHSSNFNLDGNNPIEVNSEGIDQHNIKKQLNKINSDNYVDFLFGEENYIKMQHFLFMSLYNYIGKTNNQIQFVRAILSNNVEVFSDYINLHPGIDLNKLDFNGLPPLHLFLSSTEVNIDILKKLLDSGRCNVNLIDSFGCSPLHIATVKVILGVYDISVLSLLLDSGADLRLVNSQGYSSLDFVTATDNQQLKDLFKKYTKLSNHNLEKRISVKCHYLTCKYKDTIIIFVFVFILSILTKICVSLLLK